MVKTSILKKTVTVLFSITNNPSCILRVKFCHDLEVINQDDKRESTVFDHLIKDTNALVFNNYVDFSNKTVIYCHDTFKSKDIEPSGKKCLLDYIKGSETNDKYLLDRLFSTLKYLDSNKSDYLDGFTFLRESKTVSLEDGINEFYSGVVIRSSKPISTESLFGVNGFMADIHYSSIALCGINEENKIEYDNINQFCHLNISCEKIVIKKGD